MSVLTMQGIMRIGTDCSGIEAPIQALEQLGIPYRHVFSSEIDRFAIESIKANYQPEKIFGDITTRNIADVPDIDVYICGFPCQAFSHAGYRGGFRDERGIVFFNCLEVIKTKKPKFFILENVKGLLTHDKGRTFKTILSELENLPNYTVHWDVLNTRDYGIPQNRPRVFIIGFSTDGDKTASGKSRDGGIRPFTTPPQVKMKNLGTFIDDSDTYVHPIPPCVIKSGMLDIIPEDAKFVDFGFKQHRHANSSAYTPTINANNRLWCVPKHRYANIKELLRLQGFPEDFKQVVSKTQLKKQIGNSMSVNVIVEILRECLACTHLVPLVA